MWRELEQYKSRICEIGVDGHALYSLEGKDTWQGSPCFSHHCRSSLRVISPCSSCAAPADDVLEQDIRMQYRLHRNLFLDAITQIAGTLSRSSHAATSHAALTCAEPRSHVQSPHHMCEERCLW